MGRPKLFPAALLLVACRTSTELRTPSAPSFTGTVTYAAGGSVQLSGSQGHWFFTAATQVTVLGLATWQGQSDSLHPAVTGLQVILAGPQFSTFPVDVSIRVGADNGATLGVWVMSGLDYYAYAADSGRVTVQRLGGGYAHLDVTIWCAPLRFSGTLEVPEAT
jgi:hypothetical protein